MRMTNPHSSPAPSGRRLGFIKSFKRDDSGVTMIEFAMVGLPFLMLLLSTFGYGIYLFDAIMLDSAAENVSRQVRTGEANQRKDADGNPSPLTASEFKDAVCEEAGVALDCENITVHVQSSPDWSDITPQECLDESGVQATGSPGTNGDDGDADKDSPLSNLAGEAGDVYMLTLCYEAKIGSFLPFLNLGQMANGSAVLQSTVTFRTEPYQ